jgi:hypothetical protein
MPTVFLTFLLLRLFNDDFPDHKHAQMEKPMTPTLKKEIVQIIRR